MSGISREQILERIRRGLGAAAAAPARERLARLREAGIFEPIADRLARFEAECAANRTELVRVTAASAAAALETVLAGGGGENLDGGVLVQDAPALRSLAAGLGPGWQRRLHWSSDGRGPQPASGARPAEARPDLGAPLPPAAALGPWPTLGTDLAGVTLAEALVARTGSILVSAACGGRAASVLPPLHVVYARATQIVTETEEALALIQAGGAAPTTSLFSLITGPSRTSDIEKMLVLGAHGPRRLVVLLDVEGG